MTDYINKLRYIHSFEILLSNKGSPNICTNIKGVMLSEKSQSQEVVYCMSPFIYRSPLTKDKMVLAENRSVVARDEGWPGQ